MRFKHNLVFLAIFVSFGLSSCSYHFQGSRNPLKELGVEKIYVKSFKNLTYRPGIEQLFTTAMIRELEKSKAFRVVSLAKDADAVLSGQINFADSSISSEKGLPVSGKDIQIASAYSANVNCTVMLSNPDGRVIFTQTIGGSKVYPASTQTGDSGSTAPLVNDSEQRFAYQYLSTQLMASVYQRMIDLF